jgi:phosphomannomutase/phosphoglucomutase
MKTGLNPSIFREYDIRGVVGRDLTGDTAETLGLGLGTCFRARGLKIVTLGRDNRLSSPELSEGMKRGLLCTGCDVIDIGLVPTPLLYFSLFNLDPDGGVMITGSHNPPEFNGFKVAIGKSTIHGDQIQEIRKIIETGSFARGSGTARSTGVVEAYERLMREKIRLDRPLKVVVDAGSGTAGPIACRLIRELGCEVTELYTVPDGTYPGHFPDPTIPGNLAEAIDAVRRTGADLAVAYDGDADRLGVVDDRGNIVWGDQLLIVFGRDLLQRRPGAAVVFEVKCSQTLEDDIARHGGRPVMWKAGHSLIKAKMKEEGSPLGGEMSGHLFFGEDYFGYDDAIYASLVLLRILAASPQTLSEMLADVPVMASTPEIRVPCPDEDKFEVVRAITEYFKPRYRTIDVDGARVNFPGGWGLVRASNTQPILVLRFEARDETALAAIKKEMVDKLREFQSVHLPPELS